MLDIRIRIKPDQFFKVIAFLDSIWSELTIPPNSPAHIICVHEGEPYDAGIESHLHIFISFISRSESWYRKAIADLDRTRKGNALYRMLRSHENSPNYVLKTVFKAESDLNDPRVIYHKGNIPLVDYRNRYDAYVKQISKKAKRKEKEAKFKLITDYVHSKLELTESISHLIDDIINHVLDYCKEEGYAMPSKSQMEIYVLTIVAKYNNYSNYLNRYYSASLKRNFLDN